MSLSFERFGGAWYRPLLVLWVERDSPPADCRTRDDHYKAGLAEAGFVFGAAAGPVCAVVRDQHGPGGPFRRCPGGGSTSWPSRAPPTSSTYSWPGCS